MSLSTLSASKMVAAAFSSSSESRRQISPATWLDASELYIKTNKQEKIRLPDVEAKWETKTRGLLKRFENAMGGDSLRLEDLDRQTVKDWLWETYPKAGTRNRYNNTSQRSG